MTATKAESIPWEAPTGEHSACMTDQDIKRTVRQSMRWVRKEFPGTRLLDYRLVVRPKCVVLELRCVRGDGKPFSHHVAAF